MSRSPSSPLTGNLFSSPSYASPSRVALAPRQVAAVSPTLAAFSPNTQGAIKKEQQRIRRNEQARLRRAAEREAKGLGAGRGRERMPLADRVATARSKGKVLDVSLLSSGGNAKTIATPQFSRKRLGDVNIGILSNNPESYRMALEQLGYSGSQLTTAMNAYNTQVPSSGGGRARGPAKTPEEIKAQRKIYSAASRARRKLATNANAKLTPEESMALRISDERKTAKENAKFANLNPQARAYLGVANRSGVLSPRSRTAMNM